jgi:hypothetical protein
MQLLLLLLLLPASAHWQDFPFSVFIGKGRH